MKRMVWVCMLLLVAAGYAKEVKPLYELTATHMVTDILLDDGRLYAATYGGTVDVFDVASRKRSTSIALPNIKDFMGDEVAPKIYAIDRLNGRMIMVSEGRSGYRNVFLHDGSTLTRIVDSDQQFVIKKGVFVDDDHILLGLLGSEIILYRISTKEMRYRKPIKARRSGGSAFSDMVLDEARQTVATADESGEVNIFNVADFKHLKLLTGQNVDNIYRIDYKQGTVITAGQDRRCAVYKPDGTAYYVEGTFLIYGAALTPSAKLGLFAATMDNDLQVFDTGTRRKIALLKGHGATLTDIACPNETECFSSAEEKRILFWKISQ